jgi:hypothetical protein
MDMSSNYYIVFLIALMAAIAAMQQEQLGIAFIAFGVAIVAFWFDKRKRKGQD